MVSDWSVDNGINTVIKIHVHEGVKQDMARANAFRRESAL